jgi:hypothetical protein
MAVPWPSDEARERYIDFLELELRVLKSASEGSPDPAVLSEFDRLLGAWFPRTRAFIESRVGSDPAGGFSDEVRTVAWAEARAVPSGDSAAVVPGNWTERQIGEDINACFLEARRRTGL